MSPCPHCRSVARIEPSRAMRWRCGVCGAPIVPTEGTTARSNGELASLVAAQRAGAMVLGWTAATFVLGAIGVMALGLAMLAWIASHVAAIVLGVLAGAAAALSVASAARARRADAERRAKLDAAWERVAGEVLQSRGGAMTAVDLARTMHIDEDQAETLLGLLSASGRASVAVREDADLAYRVEGSSDAPALRLDAAQDEQTERARGRER